MKQPKEPRQEDCCNSGCSPCVFDVYDKQLKQYQTYLKTGESGQGQDKENAISQLSYTTFVLTDKATICDSHMLLYFKLANNGSKVWWNPGDHFLTKYSAGESHCTRPYTPIRLDDKCDNNDRFMILVKEYNNGMVSKYLCSLEVGSHSSWRGPYGVYKIVPNKYKRIVMIAQGTGIAPFISIINEILSNENDMTKIILYYCCGNKNSIPLRETLYEFKSYWNLSYHIFLKEAADDNFIKYKEPITNCRLSLDYFGSIMPFTNNDNILLCGSKQFSEYYKNYLLDINVCKENLLIF